MSIPAETSLDTVALHGLETRHHVFGVTGKKVTIVRQAVGEGRAVVEHKFFGVTAGIDGCLER